MYGNNKIYLFRKHLELRKIPYNFFFIVLVFNFSARHSFYRLSIGFSYQFQVFLKINDSLRIQFWAKVIWKPKQKCYALDEFIYCTRAKKYCIRVCVSSSTRFNIDCTLYKQTFDCPKSLTLLTLCYCVFFKYRFSSLFFFEHKIE